MTLGIKVDLRNYNKKEVVGEKEISRLDILNDQKYGLNACEVHLISKDYEDLKQFKEFIVDFGSNLSRTLKFLSLHYPWQYTFAPEEFEKQTKNAEFTVEQIDILNQFAAPEKIALTTHYQGERDINFFNKPKEELIAARKDYLDRGSKELNRIMQFGTIRQAIKTGLADVLIENNPPSGTDYHLSPGQNTTFALCDITPNDMKSHAKQGLKTVLDIPHVKMWEEYYNKFAKPIDIISTEQLGEICKKTGRYPNAELLRELYGGVPNFYQVKSEKRWLEDLKQTIGLIHVAGCGGYTKEHEGIDLFDNRNKVDANILRDCPIPKVIERANSWKDLPGDMKNIEYLQGIGVV